MAFSMKEQVWIETLKSQEYHQGHLLEGATTEGIQQLLRQIETLDANYPGGLLQYLQRAKHLLMQSRDGINPFQGAVPTIPLGHMLVTGTPEFDAFETAGLEHLHQLAFVLVAGGLGERLGYPDIKVGLPIETVSGMTYIEYYIRMILACERYAEKQRGKRPCLPFAIMTSDDTHEKTLKLLKSHNCFGFPENQLTILKQQRVAAFTDNNATFATTSSNRYVIETKPHGHGDVHTLLNQHGLPKKWVKEGKQWMLIFQDTNGLVSHAICPMLGVCIKNNFVMNSLTVPRAPGEAVGAICKLEKDDGSHITINVEYNQLNPLLIASGKGGDTKDPTTGMSPFPGNTNVLMFNLPRYSEVLESTGGAVPEFVNPKYRDEAKTTFKSAARLECLMQEFPRLLNVNDKVGITQLDRWLCFSTVKNNVADAAAKSKVGGVPESPFTGEADEYFAYSNLLELAAKSQSLDVDIAAPIKTSFLDIQYKLGPKVVMDPSFAITLDQVKRRIKGGPIKIAQGSTLVLEGDVDLYGLELDGALILRAPQQKLVIKNLKIHNKGWEVEELDGDSDVPLSIKVRGYQIKRHEHTELFTA